MSEAQHSLSRDDLQRLIDRSPFDLSGEERLLRKRSEAQRRLEGTMRLLDGVEDALRQVRSTR
jgi:hypothetical protein